jgi:DNA-binding NtrC family response regulator
MKRILIVDDEIEMLESLKKILMHRDDYEISSENDPARAMELLNKKNFDLVISDLKMGDYSGIDLLREAFKLNPGCNGIIISGYGTIEASVEAIRIGAFDFLEKPFSSRKLFDTIDKAFQQSIKVLPTGEEEDEVEGICCKSKKMKEVINLIKKVAPTDLNLLIVGESGTGKELAARAIHKLSKGKTNPFVPVNCGALPETLFESELFGYEKGAFTGAERTKPGLLEFANEGTFFFDEIGDMSMALQVKLLRMLEEHKIRRIGGQEEIDINVRIIAATNKDIEHLIHLGRFREDLYYRLNSFTIEIPPLRSRDDDIIPLVNSFLYNLNSKGQNKNRTFSPEAEEFLKTYSWPGNVRELQNIVNRAYFMSSGDVISDKDVPLPTAKKENIIDEIVLDESFKDAKDKLLEKFEIEYLTYHLKKNDGNISKTAEICGIDRRTVHRLISKYNIVYKD